MADAEGVVGEGIVQYRLKFKSADPATGRTVATLAAWAAVLQRLALIGRDARRYDGFAFGNLSARMPGDGFLISGTQTAGETRLGAGHFSRVTGCSLSRNEVTAEGPVAPSSEALTHAALYRADPGIRCVFHAHSPDIWSQRHHYPVSDPQAQYGTTAMAEAVADLHRQGRLAGGVLCMGGHRDGILSFAADADAAGCRLVTALADCLRRAKGE